MEIIFNLISILLNLIIIGGMGFYYFKHQTKKQETSQQQISSKNESHLDHYQISYIILQIKDFSIKKLFSLCDIKKKQHNLIKEIAQAIYKLFTDHFEGLLKKAKKMDIVADTDDYKIYSIATKNNLLITKDYLENSCGEYDLSSISDEKNYGRSMWLDFMDRHVNIMLQENEKIMDMFYIKEGTIKKEELKKSVREDIGKKIYEDLKFTLNKLREIEIDGKKESEFYENKIKELCEKYSIEYKKDEK